MQLCKTCNALMIGRDAPKSYPRLKRLLKRHGAFVDTIDAVATSLGPICNRCLKSMERTLKKS